MCIGEGSTSMHVLQDYTYYLISYIYKLYNIFNLFKIIQYYTVYYKVLNFEDKKKTNTL